MRVESSFSVSASTYSSRMAPSSSDNCTSFSINYSRLIGAVTFFSLVQSLLTCVDLTCSPRAMTLKISFFSLSIFQDGCSGLRMYVGCTNLVPCKRLCVHNTYFSRKQLIAYVYDLCNRGGLCVRVRLFV